MRKDRGHRQAGGWLAAAGRLLFFATGLVGFLSKAEQSSPLDSALTKLPWSEFRTAHFKVFSCGPTQEVTRVAARLEQFREAYALLAGAQAVASPPIVAIAFPDHPSMKPFLPVYQGKPANLAAFFHRDSDENFIALYVAGAGADSLEPVFHEYTHLLLRHNMLFWPMWLNEGMADVYSTFEATPDMGVRIGSPLPFYLKLLEGRPLMSLRELFAVTPKSPEYNERERQGIFYAESWLLTHYLMLGDSAVMKSRFGELTTLLRKGEVPEQAFTNAFHVSLTQMENQLRAYLKRGQFEPLRLSVRGNLLSARAVSIRPLVPVEVWFHLGDMLLRIGRDEEAKEFFARAQAVAPRSPLPAEGFGLLAARRNESGEAAKRLQEALRLGSVSFLAHYTYARERYRLTAKTPDSYSRVSAEIATEIETEIQKSISLMPEFAPAHELLGFFLMAQGERLQLAEQHLQRAIQLEPENESYLFSLAQLQVRKHDPQAARRTLEPLRVSYVNPGLKKHAEEMLKEIDARPGAR
jgi:tetratricopeptide (TPR) repeat protein